MKKPRPLSLRVYKDKGGAFYLRRNGAYPALECIVTPSKNQYVGMTLCTNNGSSVKS